MQMQRCVIWRATLVVWVVVALAVPAALAQSAPPGAVVQKMVTTDPLTRTITVTETTLNANGEVIKVEITVTRDGQFLSKVEKIFDPATGQVVRREEKIVVNGQVIERKFVLLNGVLTLVKDEHQAGELEHQQEPEHGPGHH